MKTKILPYSELKNLPGYEDLCETSYNTLVEVVDKILPQAKLLNLSCKMKAYGGYGNLTKGAIIQRNECGTAACVMGVIATLFTVNPDHFYKLNPVFSYPTFQTEKIPMLFEESTSDENSMWYFLFGEEWPNSFEAGVERIKTVLAGQYDENWYYE